LCFCASAWAGRFLWAGIHYFGDAKFVVGFLSNVKTVHAVYAPFTNPTVVPILTFLVEYHIVFAGILGYLIARRVGHVWGLDGLIERWHVVESHPGLKPLVG